MYVCLCNGYTDRQVREAAPQCLTAADVYRALGAPPRVDFIETQIELIDQIGIQNYIQLQSEPAKDS